MRFFAIIALCLLALLALTKPSMAAAEDNETCPCPRNLEPVCGSDSVTYPNRCEFRCAAQNAKRRGRSLTLSRMGAC